MAITYEAATQAAALDDLANYMDKVLGRCACDEAVMSHREVKGILMRVRHVRDCMVAGAPCNFGPIELVMGGGAK